MQMGRLVSIVLFLSINLACSQHGLDIPAQTGLTNQTFVAKVIRIIDGDTMEVLYDGKPLKIRLAHIDCPEKRGAQPFNSNAKKALSDLCFGQKVTLYSQEYDRYKRLIAVIINDKKQIVNQEMIKQGLAWHFKRYSKDPIYHQLELDARKNKIGIWQEPNPTPPWQWRETKHPVSR